MPASPVATTSLELVYIHPNPNQPRKFFDTQAIEDLRASMAERGLINPISVVKTGEQDYMIIAGERRYRAARELKWSKIDCRVWPKETTREEVEMLSIVENVQRTDLKPLEVASGYLILSKPPYNMSDEQIAQKIGKTRQTVWQYLSIVALDQKVRDLLNRFNNFGLAHILQICRLKEVNQQVEMIESAGKNEWSVKELTRKVNTILRKPDSSPRIVIPVTIVDPLAELWNPLLTNTDFTPDVAWQVDFKGGSKRDQSPEEWHFHVRPNAPDKTQALAVWFTQMAKVLNDYKPSMGTVPRGQSQLLNEMKAMKDGLSELSGEPRLPKTDADEKELENIALHGTPKDVYTWIYGKGSPMVTVAPATWKEVGLTPLDGLKTILEGIQKYSKQ